jgi:hypothetical protein
VTWNLDWFGKDEIPVTDPGPWGPLNEDVQERNVKTIIKNLDADVYAFEEVVDTTRFKRLIDTLGGPSLWGYAFSDFCSGATAPTDPFYAGGQKLGFIYRKANITNVSTRGMLRTSTNYDSTYRYWSSGRFPYLLHADVTLGAVTQPVDFIVIHAKANTGTDAEKIDSYNRRKKGLQELKDSLDANFASSNIILLGDYNDDLDRTIAPITSGPDTVSSYNYMIIDSTDANSYKSITLPLSLQNLRSTVSNTNVIDHQVVSNEMYLFYMPGTAAVRTEVVGLVANSAILYSDSTTDHYPVYSRFNFLQAPIPVKLFSFTAQKTGTAVKLNWATEQEINSRYFEVQRSADGSNWSTIATINAAGNSNTKKEYETTDYAPAKGINFYRLKQVDMDAKFQYSFVRSVLFSSSYQVIVSPNPAADFINVYVAKDNSKSYTVQLLDMSGRILKTATTVQPLTQFATASLTKGVYTVRITDGGNTTIKKVSVQ